jgi:hypothetical protein
LESDLIWENAIRAFTGEKQTRYKLINFFALLLITGTPKNPLKLIDTFQLDFFLVSLKSYKEKLQELLLRLEIRLRLHGMNPNEAGDTCCEQLGLPKPDLFNEKTDNEAVAQYYF